MLRDSFTCAVVCPFCQADDCTDCNHFQGWTSDGRTIDDPKQGRSSLCTPEPILESDRVLTTGVSARVYRP